MSASDTRHNIAAAHVQPVEDENGNLYTADLVFVAVFQFPTGPGEFTPIPIGTHRFGLEKKNLKGFAEELLRVAESLDDRPKPSGIQVASSLQGVDKAIEQTQRLRG